MIISPNTIFFRTSVNSISMFKAMSLQMWHIWYYFLSSYDIFETLRLSYTHARKNNKIEQRSYSNHEFGCYIKSNFACCNIRKPSLSINMLKHDRTILLFYQSCSIMLTVLLQGCWGNNRVIACIVIFLHLYTDVISQIDWLKWNYYK